MLFRSYEHVSFKCRRCHAHGHLFRDCPLNASPQNKEADTQLEADGFTKVPPRRRHNKKSSTASKKSSPSSNAPSTSNSFAILSDTDPPPESSQVPPNSHHLPPTSTPSSGHANPSSPQQEKTAPANPANPTSNPSIETKLLTWHTETMDLDYPKSESLKSEGQNVTRGTPNLMEEDYESLELGDLDIIGLEDACKHQEFDKIKPHQIDTLAKVLSKAQQQEKLGV